MCIRDSSDPVGRVANIPNSVKFKKMDVEIKDSATLSLKNFPSCKLQVVFHVNDAKTIERIKDGRYLTTSIGASSQSAKCSICGQDIASELCEHMKGNVYDDELCYWIVEDLSYHENSIVAVPADQSSGHVAKILGWMPVEDYNRLRHEFSVRNMDPNKIDIIKVLENKISPDEYIQDLYDSMNKKEETMNEDKLKPQNLDEEKPDIKDQEKETNDEQTNPKEDKAKTDTAPKDEENLNKDTDNENDDEEYLEVDDEHYEAMWAEWEKLQQNDEINEDFGELYDDIVGKLCEITIDAKLTPAKRKKLPKSVFCKPSERKYPVPDCAHARVAMAYAKKYNEPAYVIACIRRKAKALGCPFKTKKSKDSSLDQKTKSEIVLTDIVKSAKYTELLESLNNVLVENIALLRYILGKDEFASGFSNGFEFVQNKYAKRTIESLRDTISDLKEELEKRKILNFEDDISDKDSTEIGHKDDDSSGPIDEVDAKGIALIKTMLNLKKK